MNIFAEHTPIPYDMEDDAVVTSSWDDALERDGQMLVLCGNDVSLLSPVATEAALVAREGVTVAALERMLTREFGMPDGASPGEVTRQIIAALISRGVMTLQG